MQVPLEHDEAVRFAEWCEWNKVPCWHIPQETFTKNFGTKMKNKQEGVRPGISDYVIFIPKGTLWIELKRQRKTKKNGEHGASPSKTSIEQTAFIELVNSTPSSQGTIAYGADEAIAFVEKFL